MTRAFADYLETYNPANEKRIVQLQGETAEALRKYQEHLAK